MSTHEVCPRTVTAALLAILLGVAAIGDTDGVPTQGTMKVVPPGSDDKTAVDLPLKHTEVTAEISGFVTRVKVVQTFSNPYDSPIEAVYVFPLPQDAAVSDMTIRIGDRIIKGQIKRREEAKQIYENAKKAGKTAALLEQERPNIFTQSLANIMPGSDILVEITYDQVLKYEGGGYEFAFPMVVGPRFIPGTPTGKQAGGWAPDTDKVPDASRITPPVLKPGERNGHDISVTVNLSAGVPVHKLTCPSHDVVITGAGEDGAVTGPVTITLKPHDTIPNKDFVLRYEVAGQKPEIGFLAHRGEMGGTFMLMFQPPELPKAETVTPKEMVFVMDCSGSMSGEPIALSKKAVRRALQNLNPGDSFQIIRFSESASPFSPGPLENTPENVRRGLSYINGLEGEGGTMMIEGIKAALDYPHQEGRLRIVCFMTDGYIGNEGEILKAIEDKLGDNTRLFSFGVGSSVNRYLLERMGEVGRGEVQYVLLNEKPDEAVNRFYERVRNPVLTHIEVDWYDLDVQEIVPARIRDLFAGQPIFVLGRYGRSGHAAIRVHAKVAGQPVTYEIPVSLPDAEPENGALAPLWARWRIKELEAEQYGRQDNDVVEKVTELALKYRLMSPYTSFVAVEEKVVNEGGQVKTIQVPVEMPEGVSYEGVFGSDHYAGAQVAGSMPMGERGLFAQRRARSLGGVMSPSILPPKEQAEPEADAASLVPVPEFTLRFASSDGSHVIEITRAGEVWVARTDSRILKTRLRQDDLRRLWGLLDRALSAAGSAPAGSAADGTLTLHVFGEGTEAEKEVTVHYAPGKTAASGAWDELVKRVIELGS